MGHFLTVFVELSPFLKHVLIKTGLVFGTVFIRVFYAEDLVHFSSVR